MAAAGVTWAARPDGTSELVLVGDSDDVLLSVEVWTVGWWEMVLVMVVPWTVVAGTLLRVVTLTVGTGGNEYDGMSIVGYTTVEEGSGSLMMVVSPTGELLSVGTGGCEYEMTTVVSLTGGTMVVSLVSGMAVVG